jgi:hypothetical protein
LLTTIATIPLHEKYLQESLVLARDANDTLLIGWLNAASSLVIAMLNNDHTLSIWDLGSSAGGIALIPLATRGFGVVHTRRRFFEACVLQDGLTFSPFQSITHSEGAGMSALPLADGALGVSSAKMLVAHLPGVARNYIVDVTDDAWHAGAAALANGEIVRVISGQHDQHTHPPRYCIRGRRFAADLTRLDDFALLLPSKIIDNTYAYPGHLVVAPLNISGFVVAWTLLPHHLGNQIQFQRFDHAGEPQGSIVTVTDSDPSSYVTKVSLSEGAPGYLLLGWTRMRDQQSRTQLVGYAIETGTTTVLHQTNWRALTGGLAVTANHAGQIWTVEADFERLLVSQSESRLNLR